MKKLLALLLVFAMLLPLAACGEKPAEPAPAEPTVTEPTPAEPTPAEPEPVAEPAPAEPEPEPVEEVKANIPADKETMIKALWETALAYYHKNPYMQYDAHSMTLESKWVGPMRCTHYAPPEYAAADQSHYSQCADFVYDVIYNAWGYAFWDGKKAPWSTDVAARGTKDIVYLRYDVTADNVKDAVAEYRAALQPGDVIITYGDTGHFMLFLGDIYGDGKNYVTHCWGGSMDTDDELDKVESNGSIYIQTEDDLLFGKNTGGPNWDLNKPSHYKVMFCICRVMEAEDFKFEITPAAATRLQYPGMVIDRSADRTQYNDVEIGSDVTITVTVDNRSTQEYKGVHVVEQLPEGVTLKEGQTEWTVDVPARQKVELSYTVTVTAPRNSLILFPAGKVGDIETREIELQVGGKHLTQKQLDDMTMLRLGYFPDALKETGFKDLQFANDFYREVLGIELGLPATINDYLGYCFKKTNLLGSDTKMLKQKDAAAEYQFLKDMEVREHASGKYMSMGMDVNVRVMEIKESFFQPGDIYISLADPNETVMLQKARAFVYIYLGGGMVARQDIDKGPVVESFNSTIGRTLMHAIHINLRPTMAWDDINAK